MPVLAGSRKSRIEIGDRAMGDPGFAATQRIAVVGDLGPGRHAGDVRARLRLRQGVSAELVTGDQRRQQRLLLLRGPECDERRQRHDMHRNTQPDAEPRSRNLLQRLQVHLVWLSSTTEPLRKGQSKHSGVAEHVKELAREPCGRLPVGCPGPELAQGDLPDRLHQLRRLWRWQHPIDGHWRS